MSRPLDWVERKLLVPKPGPNRLHRRPGLSSILQSHLGASCSCGQSNPALLRFFCASENRSGCASADATDEVIQLAGVHWLGNEAKAALGGAFLHPRLNVGRGKKDGQFTKAISEDLGDVETVESRHVDVEQNAIHAVHAADLGQGIGAVGGDLDCPIRPQFLKNCLGKGPRHAAVVYHENRFRHRSPSGSQAVYGGTSSGLWQNFNAGAPTAYLPEGSKPGICPGMITVPALALMMMAAPSDFMEAPLVPGHKAMSETGRYASPRSFDDTVKYYKDVFKRKGGVRWRGIINQTGIKAVHLQHLRKKSHWAGINIYEHKGKVRIFVIPRRKQDK